ncbi:MAG: hypothetical protein U9R32_00770 [Bacteroidota bacterium]|nr:hypothetical protein [Bacteroidota bacterium]
MEDKYIKILENVKELTLEKGIEAVTIDDICKSAKITKEKFYTIFNDDDELVKKILQFSREKFLTIVDRDYKKANAIETLLLVSEKINELFNEVNPFMMVQLKKNFYKTYQKHFDILIEFTFNRISLNLKKGISENLYRKDLSIELVARLYISRLIDIHNPDLFPPSKISFKQLFEVMFENFVRGIATSEGLKIFEKKKPQHIN